MIMKKSIVFGIVLVVSMALTCVGTVKAGILSLSCASDDDGAINGVQTGWNYQGSDTYNVNIKGNQLRGPGAMVMDFTTDTPDDPTIKSINQVENDTDLAWTGYLIDVTLDVPSLLTTYSISNPIVSPSDWTAVITTQPVAYTGTQYEYKEEIELDGGTPIGTNDELDFSYNITFAGVTTYHAIQEQTPISADPVLVPEPSMLVLLAVGAAGLLAVLWRRRATKG